MSSLMERLREALRPDYEILREIGRGGMGIVYLGRDTTLDRPVAVKLLRPELLTATALERFLREARLLAATRHPNIVTIHQARETNGLAYLVMDYLEGESLDKRFARGPLPSDEVVTLADDLLAGLGAAHDRGIVHRDVKPANVMFVDGQYVLGDFGIAKRTESDSDPLTHPDGRPGTPAYMSPEQLAGGTVTARADVYGAGALLYEAMTGRRWQFGDAPAEADWAGVPRKLAGPVARALAIGPEERYADAGAFRRALKRARVPSLRAALPWAALAVGVVIVLRVLLGGSDPPAPVDAADLALLPFEPDGTAEEWLPLEIPLAVYRHLEGGFEGAGLRLLSVGQTRRWWDSASTTVADTAVGPVVWRGLHALHAVSGTYRQWGDSLAVRLRVVDSSGGERPTPAVIRGTLSGLQELGFRVGRAVAQAVDPTRAASYRGSPALRGLETEPFREFLRADAAFEREEWTLAAAGYRRALALDSTLGLAWWHLFNALRWAREAQDVDLAAIYTRYQGDFTPVQRLLIEAETGPPGAPRFARYAEAIAREPRDGHVQLLYGNELFHRGALFGVGLDSAVRTLERATQKHPWLAPAFSTLAWAETRQGNRDAARAALDRYHAIAATETAPGFSFAQVLEYAFVERFEGAEAGRYREMLLGQLHTPEARHQFIARNLRWAPASGIPHAQLALAERLQRIADLPAEDRANLHEARGLALYRFGRVREALGAFDSAAALFGTSAARLEAAQWRLLPYALGLLPVEPERVVAIRTAVTALADDPAVAARAQWTLVVDALGRDDLPEADRWTEKLATNRADSSTAPLLHLARAHRALTAGDPAAALELSVPFLGASTARHAGGGDPFARTVAHLLRGSALAARGDGAVAELLWYENADIEGWPTGPADPGEVDWALAMHGAVRRAAAEVAVGDRRTACARYAEVATTWDRADPAVLQAVDLERRRARACR